MNTFEDSEDENDLDIITYDISVFSIRRGKKVMTYFSGWLDDKKELTKHLKVLKNKHGCNGSVKYKAIDNDEEKKLYFMLQGDWVDIVKKYIENNEKTNFINFIKN